MPEPQRSFVLEALAAILAKQSPLLLKLSKAAVNTCRIEHTIKRFSRRLNNERYDDEAVREGYLRRIEPALQPLDDLPPLALLDQSDIRKPKAKKMEGLGRVWDGSEQRLVTGYPLFLAALRLGPGRAQPLQINITRITADATRKMLRSLRPWLPANTVVVADRGFDGHEFYDAISETPSVSPMGPPRAKLEFVIRLADTIGKDERTLFWEDKPYSARRFLDFAEWRSVEIPRRTLDEQVVQARVGFVKRVRLPAKTPGGQSRAGPAETCYSLVMIKYKTGRPIFLLTTILVDTHETAFLVARIGRERWQLEDGIKFLKTFGLEDTRLQTLRSLERMINLQLLAWGYVALMDLEHPEKRGQLSRKEFKGEAPVFSLNRLVAVEGRSAKRWLRSRGGGTSRSKRSA